MKKSLARLICAVLCIALLTGTLGIATAAKMKSEADSGLADLVADWYYVKDTVPEGMLTEFRHGIWLYNYRSKDSNQSEAPTIHEVTFKSGDEALKDALSFEESKDSDGKVNYVSLVVDNECLKAPGEAKFQVKLESEHFNYQDTYTLRVVDWNEHPLLEKTDENLTLDGQVGDQWSRKELVGRVMKVNEEEVRKQLKAKLAKGVNERDFYQISWPGEVYENDAIKSNYNEDDVILTPVKPGKWEAQVGYEYGNVRCMVPMVVTVPGLYLTAEGEVLPGKTVQMAVKGTTEGKTFTWSVEGEGAKIDEKTGSLAIDAKAPLGTELKVKALSSDGEEATLSLFLNDGIFDSSIQLEIVNKDGFYMPHPTGGRWYSDPFMCWYYGYELYDEGYGDNHLQVDAFSYTMFEVAPGGYAEDPEVAKNLLENVVLRQAADVNDEYEFIEIDGHPALLIVGDYYRDGVFENHHGLLYYARDARLLRYRVFSDVLQDPAKGADDIPKVTMTDLKMLASMFGYDANQAPFSPANAAISLTAKGDPAGITAGKSIQFKAAFADTTKTISTKNENTEITWSVTDADGKEVPAATISDKGKLDVDKTLDAPVDLVVKAASPIFGTEATYQLTAMPVISAVTIEPTELFFYTGTDTAQTVKVTLDPPIAAKGINWTPNKEGVVEITDNGDGTVSIKPVAAGKISIDVKEPGGKKAKLAVNVVEPVTALTLTAKGAAKPGGNVTVSAATEPKNPGNKTLEWALNVGEDIAVINDKGQVKISKEAPLGTKITVTCKALGAPEPVAATIDLEVVEK